MGIKTERLSSFLGGDEAIARDPYGRLHHGTERTTEYRGTTSFAGLLCQLVRSTVWITEPRLISNYVDIWLAEEGNLIPVRLLGYEPDVTATEPLGEGLVLEWKEIEPSIWFPMRVEFVSFDSLATKARGARQLGSRREYRVESISLRPDYERSFFQDVPIPEGTIVCEYDEGGRQTRSYRQGSPSEPGALAKGVLSVRWQRFAVLALILIVAMLGVLYVRRRRSQHARRR